MWCVLVSMCAFRSVFSASALCFDKFDILGRIARTECEDAAPCECCSVICLSVCLSVRLLDTTLSPTKKNEMTFGLYTWVGPVI